jgi:iron complex transport system ATP-binding protein
MEPLFEAASITVRAGGKTILDSVSFDSGPGRMIALIGPNGAGKSTLLRALAGEIKPQSGQIRLRGKDIASYAPDALALRRAVLSQSTSVAFPFTAGEIVRMGIDQRRAREAEPLVAAALAELELDELADRTINSLSGGEQQRVHFARVLAQLDVGERHEGNGVLLLDEPTNGLDLSHQLGMVDAIKRRVRNGALAIAVFHDLNLATLVSDHIVVIDDGRIVCRGRPDETITGPVLERVFSVATTVGQSPPPGVPFVLPQVMTPLRATSRPQASPPA